MKKSNKLNCLIVAMRLWFSSRGRSIFGVRRSESLGGLIPHALVIRERGVWLTVIDYVPRKRKASFFGRGDFVLWFRGRYRVRRYRLVGKGTGDCFRSAICQLRKDKKLGLPGCSDLSPKPDIICSNDDQERC